MPTVGNFLVIFIPWGIKNGRKVTSHFSRVYSSGWSGNFGDIFEYMPCIFEVLEEILKKTSKSWGVTKCIPQGIREWKKVWDLVERVMRNSLCHPYAYHITPPSSLPRILDLPTTLKIDTILHYISRQVWKENHRSDRWLLCYRNRIFKKYKRVGYSNTIKHYEKKLTKNIRPTDILQIYTSI